jgi:hypothetical protein
MDDQTATAQLKKGGHSWVMQTRLWDVWSAAEASLSLPVNKSFLPPRALLMNSGVVLTADKLGNNSTVCEVAGMAIERRKYIPLSVPLAVKIRKYSLSLEKSDLYIAATVTLNLGEEPRFRKANRKRGTA